MQKNSQETTVSLSHKLSRTYNTMLSNNYYCIA